VIRRGLIARVLVGTIFGAALLAGCGASGSQPRTYVGQVTDVHDGTVCIGGPKADGECFANVRLTQDLRVNDCVRVTYARDSQEQGPYIAEKVTGVQASQHTVECPSQ
jgi:hypothetical protein